MKLKIFSLFAAILCLGFINPTQAEARVCTNFSVNIGAGPACGPYVVQRPYPVYVQPAPVAVYQPMPVYQPAPVVVYPQQYYEPVYVQPAPVRNVGFSFGWGCCR
ncbi:hypothetical protein BN1013_01520 [Candidatus Rubidus massiliensis]|nr:hypothetical protein BN1013_01520 [Candidatus Rubidus massiliensis]